MRRAALLSILLVLVPAATARAQGSVQIDLVPRITTPGVSAQRLAGGRAEIRFANTAAGRRAYRGLAGRRVRIECLRPPRNRVVGAPATRGPVTRVSMPRRRSTVRLRVGRALSVCYFNRRLGVIDGVKVGLDAAGRAYLADLDAAFRSVNLETLLWARVQIVGPSRAMAPLLRGYRARQLGDPAEPLPSGATGLFLAGDRTAAVVRTRAGRRLFTERQGDLYRTNGLSLISQVSATAAGPSGLPFPSGPRPDPAAPLPSSTDPGVTAERREREIVITLSDAARERYTGERVNVSCQAGGSGTSQDGPAPAPGRPIVVETNGRAYRVCGIADAAGGPAAYVALDDTGRQELETGILSAAMGRVLSAAGRGASTAYPGPSAIAARFGGRIVALTGPDERPGDLRVGVWSDGARRLVITATTRAGRHVFFAIDGGLLTTNAPDARPLPEVGQNG